MNFLPVRAGNLHDPANLGVPVASGRGKRNSDDEIGEK
jgi:hypothetical protein